MNLQDALYGRIVMLCKERSISFYELSYRAAVPVTTLKHILDKSTKNPGIFTVNRICDGLDMKLADFLISRFLQKLQKNPQALPYMVIKLL